MKHLISFELFEALRQPQIDDRVWLANQGMMANDPNRFIDRLDPESEDISRAIDLVRSDNPVGRAESMSKLITNRAKLVRRAKAVIDAARRLKPAEFDAILSPFVRRADALGFSEAAIARLLHHGRG